MVAVQLLPQSQWVAPSSVVLQDEGRAKDENAEEEEEEEKVVNLSFGSDLFLLYSQWEDCVCCFHSQRVTIRIVWMLHDTNRAYGFF